MNATTTPDPVALRNRVFRGILLLALVATICATLFNELVGTAGVWTRTVAAGLGLSFIAALLAGHDVRQKMMTGFVYLTLTLSAAAWAGALYLLQPDPQAQRLILSLAMLLPALYAMAFLTFAPARALATTVVALVAVVLPTLPHGLGSPPASGLLAGLWFPLVLLFSHSTLIYLMHSYALLAVGLQQARQSANQMTQLAYTDELTGVANRRALEIELVRAVSLARRHNWSLAVMYIDLDQFKQVNDRHGHWAGDEVLVAVTERLKKCLRDMDFLVRLGGDEFAVLLQKADVGEAVKVCGRVAMELGAPFDVAGQPFELKASIGVAVYPEDGEDLESLLRSADAAMYQAKARGGGFAFPEARPEPDHFPAR